MCGLAGALFWDEHRTTREPEAIVSAMVQALGHRGPDGRGVVVCHTPTDATRLPVVVLGHARLAILDLSDGGAQPMRSRSASNWIVFNGEIYNFSELRRELETLGREFTSRSDTEVLLQAYEAWGLGFVDRLRGMFAFALWDGGRRELLLARDRLGIKPLYFARSRAGIAFASEVRAVLASGLVPRRLDRVALEQFLAYQTVPPPRTLVDDVRMLPPGHMLIVGADGRTRQREYWNALDASGPVATATTAPEARRRIHALLQESAALHLVSDVPVGIFLSGGIDSSAIVALVRALGHTPRTFSVVLPGSPLDEAPHARAVARAFGADHVELPLTEGAFRDDVPDALGNVDHPSGDGLNMYVVARAVRAAGIKVALSGLGGDELFGGYPSFRRLRRLATYAQVWRRSPRFVRHAAAATVRALGRSSVASAKAAAVLEGDGTLPRAFPVLRQLFRADERRALVGPDLVDHAGHLGDPYVELLDEAVDRHPRAGLTSLVSYAEARTYMHDVLLRDADQMSMAHGLETRVPLLDHRLVEYVLALPDRLKAPAATPKALLTESLGVALPVSAVRRPKQGFVLPFDTWMRGDLRGFCEHHLSAAGLGRRPPFRPEAIDALWKSFLARDGRTTWSRPWTLVALNAWMERNGIDA